MPDHECYKNADVRYERQNSIFITRGAICRICGKKWHTRRSCNYNTVNITAHKRARKVDGK